MTSQLPLLKMELRRVLMKVAESIISEIPSFSKCPTSAAHQGVADDCQTLHFRIEADFLMQLKLLASSMAVVANVMRGMVKGRILHSCRNLDILFKQNASPGPVHLNCKMVKKLSTCLCHSEATASASG